MSMPRLHAGVGLLPWALTLVAGVPGCPGNQMSQNLSVTQIPRVSFCPDLFHPQNLFDLLYHLRRLNHYALGHSLKLIA